MAVLEYRVILLGTDYWVFCGMQVLDCVCVSSVTNILNAEAKFNIFKISEEKFSILDLIKVI